MKQWYIFLMKIIFQNVLGMILKPEWTETSENKIFGLGTWLRGKTLVTPVWEAELGFLAWQMLCNASKGEANSWTKEPWVQGRAPASMYKVESHWVRHPMTASGLHPTTHTFAHIHTFTHTHVNIHTHMHTHLTTYVYKKTKSWLGNGRVIGRQTVLGAGLQVLASYFSASSCLCFFVCLGWVLSGIQSRWK